MRKLIFLLLFLLNLNTYAQLSNGSVAPDFTLTDYEGNSHSLYSYLNSGKTVFVEIFAAHCPVCWGYHQTHTLRDLYNLFGPNASNEIMVLALEHDQWNDSNAFIGNGPAWVTQGNWLDGTPFPIFNVEDPNRGVFTAYNVTFYPVIYKICPDRIVERVLTSETVTQLYQKVQNCQAALSIGQQQDQEILNIYLQGKSLVIDQYQEVKSIEILNLQGQVVKSTDVLNGSIMNISELNAGLYVFKIETDSGVVFKRMYLNGE